MTPLATPSFGGEITRQLEAFGELWGLKVTAGGLGGLFSYIAYQHDQVLTVLGGNPTVAHAMWIAVALDFVLGFAVAYKRRRVRCYALRRGAYKIGWYALFVLLVGLVNVGCSETGHGVFWLLDGFMTYMTATEAVSCVAHMQQLGIPVPDVLASLTKRMRSRARARLDRYTSSKDEGGNDGSHS